MNTKNSISVEPKKGHKYSICSCGLSKKLPYCDNAHRDYNKKHGTQYKSLKLFPSEDTTIEVFSTRWNS
jgi:CDGSH-type Zn-finger protein